MKLAKTWSIALNGIEPFRVEVEVSTNDAAGSDNFLSIVGVPDTTVRESRERVRSAINASGFHFPMGSTTISLAPAGIKKSGSALDLPIAMALIASCDENFPLEALNETVFIGELGLDGHIRSVKGALAMALYARELDYKQIYIAEDNAKEAAIAEGVKVIPVKNLSQVYQSLQGTINLSPVQTNLEALFSQEQNHSLVDFAYIKGQTALRRGLEIAACGSHNLLMIGPPGCGKTLMARSFPTILPKLSLEEALKVTQIHSIAGTLEAGQSLITQRPYRSPHHTISEAGLLGGSSNPRPGEVSLAHRGVLFLDELPEYKRSTLEVLRQPMESGDVEISRANGSCRFPADFTLISAMNPCPCGFFGSSQKECRCTSMQIQRYRNKISGPLLDRIDLHLEVNPLSQEELMKKAEGESSASIRERVEQARELQHKRFGDSRTNASLNAKELQELCELDSGSRELLQNAISSLDLSARAYDRILRVSRTIADLEASEAIQAEHIAEAIQYRSLDRKLW
ncbi:YifB family Mg chelatase-like AAA ATPase [Lentisphaera marina]|uniref:YifB family Mg chelatase-like AAA ATPase n=1 Tax=Lentisphaera marina TaxID=1111041 RepID=UPI0023662519|nr:YifB family Mg chelatase-like AAA ATPase [Lentisphaera marina]MDD7986251.1 YifB family Mg chelatase-like AAA ATPase [Lentisphaera marina]